MAHTHQLQQSPFPRPLKSVDSSSRRCSSTLSFNSSFLATSKDDATSFKPLARACWKFTFGNRSQTPTAPPTDEESLLDSIEQRNKRFSCDQSLKSSTSSLTDSFDNSNKRVSLSESARSNNSLTPPPPPERYDSLRVITEERELREAPWFQAGIPREIALEILDQEPVGSFIVRESTSKPGCFALSLRVPRMFHHSGIAHYLIMQTNRGYKIKGFTKEFSTLSALITHHSVMPELLPCPLSLSRYTPSLRRQEDLSDLNEDCDYTLLSNFRKTLTESV